MSQLSGFQLIYIKLQGTRELILLMSGALI